jgi:hypothetical protein
MILMWLGSLVMMFSGLLLFRHGVSTLGARFQKMYLDLPDTGVSTFRMLVLTKLCAVSQGSFLQSQYGAVALLNSRSYSKHYSVLLLCLSAAGLWTTLLGVLVSWQLQGAIFLGLSVVFYLSQYWFDKGRTIFKTLAGFGILLMGMQWALRDQTLLLSALGESELHFLLADGRFFAQLIWLLTSFAATLLIGIESWSVFLALVLLATGSLSLNGAVALVVGELLAHVWLLFWRSRKLNQDVTALTRSYAIASSVGLCVGFVLAGLLRTVFSWGYTFELNEIMDKNLQFFAMYLVVILSHSLAVLSWGHFAARRKMDEVQTGEYFSVRWIERGLVAASISNFVLRKLNERLALLIAQKKSLNPDERMQIPTVFLQNHENEIIKLSQWIPRARPTHLD